MFRGVMHNEGSIGNCEVEKLLGRRRRRRCAEVSACEEHGIGGMGQRKGPKAPDQLIRFIRRYACLRRRKIKAVQGVRAKYNMSVRVDDAGDYGAPVKIDHFAAP